MICVRVVNYDCHYAFRALRVIVVGQPHERYAGHGSLPSGDGGIHFGRSDRLDLGVKVAVVYDTAGPEVAAWKYRIGAFG